MKVIKAAVVTGLAYVCMCHELKLQLRDIETEANLPWAVYNYDYDHVNGSLTANILDYSIEKVDAQGALCVDAIYDNEMIPCFTFLDVNDPLQYNLVMDVHHDGNGHEVLTKLSLLRNSEITGIEPVIRTPANGPEAPAVKLKKTTKTYQDKKANKEATTAQFSEEDDGENEDKTWFQKNWKILLIGLVIYNVVTAMNKEEEAKREIAAKKKPLID